MYAGAGGPGVSSGGDGRFDHACAQEIAGAFGKHGALHGAGLVAHAAGEVAQAQAECRPIAVGGQGAVEHRLDLTHACVLLAGETKILPRGVSRTDGAGDMDGQSLVHQQLAK